MKVKNILAYILSGAILFTIACTKNGKEHEAEDSFILRALNLPSELDDYNVRIDGIDQKNANQIATIGRVLFYDTDLSSDGTISCASCHQQSLAFSDNVDFSEGVHGNLTSRNSIALASFESFDFEYGGGGIRSISRGLFWDERARSVKSQMSETIANPNEMGMALESLPLIVQSKPYYQELFNAVDFNRASRKDNIDLSNILTSIETFVRSIQSSNSRFDQELNKDRNLIFINDWDTFSESENNGKQLFFTNCSSCHNLTNQRSSLFNRNFNMTMANNGLDIDYADQGHGEVTGESGDIGRFKIPNLRNIALTGPYMHDGRFQTLEEVIDFYSTGIQNHKNLHRNLRNDVLAPRRFKFSESDKEDIVAFLNTLTDESLLTEEKWSDPFIR